MSVINFMTYRRQTVIPPSTLMTATQVPYNQILILMRDIDEVGNTHICHYRGALNSTVHNCSIYIPIKDTSGVHSGRMLKELEISNLV